MHNAWYVNAERQCWKAVLITYTSSNLQIDFLSDNILQLSKNIVFKLMAIFITIVLVVPTHLPNLGF